MSMNPAHIPEKIEKTYPVAELFALGRGDMTVSKVLKVQVLEELYPKKYRQGISFIEIDDACLKAASDIREQFGFDQYKNADEAQKACGLVVVVQPASVFKKSMTVS